MNTNLFFKKGTVRGGYTYHCSCGHIGTVRARWYGTNEIEACAKCGTKIYKNITSTKTCTGKLPILKVIYSDHTGFEVQRIDELYKFDIETKAITKTDKSKIKTLRMDYKNDMFYVINEKGEKESISRCNIKSFLKDIDDVEFINEVCNNKNIRNLMTAFYRVERMSYTPNGYSGALYDALPRMACCKWANVLANMGFNKKFLIATIKNAAWFINEKATKPNEILGVQKYMLKYLKDAEIFGSGLKNDLNWLHDNYGADNVKYMFEASSIEEALKLLGGYKMSSLKDLLKLDYDFRRLIKYIFIDVKYQGIESPYEALGFLEDTVEIAKQIGIELNEKYPKHLKETHDILGMNLRAMQKEENKVAFDKYQEQWKELEYSKAGFSIVAPKTPSDIVKEGSEMSNCVASYVDKVKNGGCIILFLRRTAAKDVSEVTLELRGNTLVQAKAFANKNIAKDHKHFLEAWAKAKKLNLNY